MRNSLLLLLMAAALAAGAQRHGTDTLRQKTIILRRFLEQNHYQPLHWDDSASVRLYDRWMELLDEEKLIFSKLETAQLVKYRTGLDEELMGKGWGFFDKTMILYRSGLLRADSIIRGVLAKPADFSKPGQLLWPQADYAADNSAIFLVWQNYLKWKILRSISDAVTDTAGELLKTQPPNFAALEVKAREQVKRQEITWVQNKLSALAPPAKEVEDDYLSAISWCYDPHTEYMSASAKSDFDTEMSGLEFSAGFEMDENEKGEWVITYLVPGGPAWRNGELHKGDMILKIRSGNRPELLLADATIEELSKIFEANSTEKITITVRTVSGAQKTARLTKEKITNEEGVVKSYVLGGVKKIGYITLPGFYVKEGDEYNVNGCSNDVAKEVVKLKKDSIAGLILDLRYNGGGSLQEALELAGIFIYEGALSSTKDRAGIVHFLRDPNRGTIYDGPLLVLVNTMSASASELVSAVLQDYHRALIVGSPTYGKGTEQVILPMDTSGNFSQTTKYESYVKVTHGKFYRVDGSTTQWKGVIPDIMLPDMYAMDKFREKATISALQPDSSRPAIYQSLPVIPVEEFKGKSTARVAASSRFTAITKFVTWYQSMDGTRTIPLDWTGYNSYYKTVMDMYRSVEDENAVLSLRVSNNSLDAQRTKLADAQSNSINEANIKRLAKDDFVAESYKIMQDWIR